MLDEILLRGGCIYGVIEALFSQFDSIYSSMSILPKLIERFSSLSLTFTNVLQHGIDVEPSELEN